MSKDEWKKTDVGEHRAFPEAQEEKKCLPPVEERRRKGKKLGKSTKK